MLTAPRMDADHPKPRGTQSQMILLPLHKAVYPRFYVYVKTATNESNTGLNNGSYTSDQVYLRWDQGTQSESTH